MHTSKCIQDQSDEGCQYRKGFGSLERELWRSETRLAAALGYITRQFGTGKLPKDFVQELKDAELKADAKSSLPGSALFGLSSKNQNELQLRFADLETVHLDHNYFRLNPTSSVSISSDVYNNGDSGIVMQDHSYTAPDDDSSCRNMDVRILPKIRPGPASMKTAANKLSNNNLVQTGQIRIIDIRKLTEPDLYGSENETDEVADIKPILIHHCKFCTANFSSLAELSIHSLIHCQVFMRKLAVSNEDLNLLLYQPRLFHIQKHPQKEVYLIFKKKASINLPNRNLQTTVKCSQCQLSFQSTWHLDQHLKRAHAKPKISSSVYKCKLCNQLFASMADVKNHVNEIHLQIQKTNQNQSASELVLRASETTKSLPLETQIPTPPASNDYLLLKCQKCPVYFQWQHQLYFHLEEVHGELPERQISKVCSVESKIQKATPKPIRPIIFKCKKCGLSYRREIQLKIHRSRDRAPGAYKCSECEEVFESECDLIIHRSQTHSEINCSLNCQYCGKKVSSLEYLRNHQRVVHPDPRDARKCEICGFVYKSQLSLRNHMRTVHAEKEFSCSKCEFTTKTAKRLDQHTKVIHERIMEERLHKCPHCPIDFKTSGQLKRHIKRHFGQDMQQCLYCGIMKNTHDMYNHVTIVHKGRKFKCKYCASMFSLRAHLKNHYVLKHPDEPMPALKEFEVIYVGESKRTMKNSDSEISDNDDELIPAQKKKPRLAKKNSNSSAEGSRPTKRKMADNGLTCSICAVRLPTKAEWELHLKRHEKDPEYRLKRRLPVKLIVDEPADEVAPGDKI